MEPRVVTVASPPRPPERERAGWQSLLGGLGSVGMLGFAFVGGNRVFLVIAGVVSVLTLAATVGSTVSGRRRAARRAATARARWRAHLAACVAEVGAAAAGQRAGLERRFPGAAGLLAAARGTPASAVAPAAATAMASSGPALTPDGWAVRLGTGAVPADVVLGCAVRPDPLAEVDESLAGEADAAVAAARWVGRAAVALELDGVVALVGLAETVLAAARFLLCSLLAAPAPGLALTVDTADPAAWHWLVWAPADVVLGSSGPGLLVVDRVSPVPGNGHPPVASRGGAGTGAAPSRRPDVRTLVLAASARDVPAGATVVDLGALPVPLAGGALLEAPDGLSAADAERVARLLAPRRQGRTGGGLLHLLGEEDPAAMEVSARWAAGRGLRVPVGMADDGSPLVLDLAEAAAGGDGPHGLLVGATGSGKSELLRSIVLALALSEPPERLELLLVDWKGGAAFDDVSALPHVGGLVTNLADDPGQVARVAASLRAELDRRQRLLRAAGAESLAALRERGGPAFPSLVVVLDEFGELLAAEPDVVDVLGACGRLGRSLGVHLLLSSQRHEEGRLRGLESHLRYRICLRVQSATESLALLGSPAAAELPAEPGWGLLAVEGGVRRFRGASSSVPAPVDDGLLVRPLALSVRDGGLPPAAGHGPAPTERAVAVSRVLALGRERVAPLWLPPLPARVAPVAPAAGSWLLPLGIGDDVAGQAQPLWALDLTACGHVAVAAGPGAGASSLLATLAGAAAAAQPTTELAVVALDFGGGRLTALDHAPHLRCLAGPDDPDLALAALREVAAEVGERLATARERGLRDAGAWRSARGGAERGARRSRAPAGEGGGAARLGAERPSEERAWDGGAAARSGADGATGPAEARLGPDLLLLVDNLGRAREELGDIDPVLAGIASGGLRVGVHVVVTVQRWADLRAGLRELVATRLELRLADPGESLLPRAAAAALAAAPPGRLVTPKGTLVQAFSEPPPVRRDSPPVRRLLPLPRVAPPRADALAVRAGDLAPMRCDARGHLLVLGDRGSGRTGLLARIATGASADPLARRVVLVDPRRTLRHLAGRPGVTWTGGGADTQQAVLGLAQLLEDRRHGGGPPPGPGDGPGGAGEAWWEGPEHLVVVDDADLLPGGAYASPLAPLAEHLRLAPDLGVAMVLARSVTGLARGGYEPVLGTLRECAAVTVVLRGDPAEGPVVGQLRARPDRPPGRATWVEGDVATDVQLVRPDEVGGVGGAGELGEAGGGGGVGGGGGGGGGGGVGGERRTRPSRSVA